MMHAALSASTLFVAWQFILCTHTSSRCGPSCSLWWSRASRQPLCVCVFFILQSCCLIALVSMHERRPAAEEGVQAALPSIHLCRGPALAALPALLANTLLKWASGCPFVLHTTLTGFLTPETVTGLMLTVVMCKRTPVYSRTYTERLHVRRHTALAMHAHLDVVVLDAVCLISTFTCLFLRPRRIYAGITAQSLRRAARVRSGVVILLTVLD